MSEWIKTAKVGDKVAYVGCGGIMVWKKFFGFLRLRAPGRHFLVAGEIYEIAGITTIDFVDGTYSAAFYLKGFKLTAWNIGSIPFPAELFRPLQRRQTSIECFERLLKTAPAPVEEAA